MVHQRTVSLPDFGLRETIHAANPGRPPFVIEKELLEDLRSAYYTWTDIAKMLRILRWTLYRRIASFALVMFVFPDKFHTGNASCLQICWTKHAYQEDYLTGFDSWWLIFVAYPLCLIIWNAAVNWSYKQGAAYGLIVCRRQGRDGILKEGVPTDQVIFELAFHIMDSWKRLGRSLGIADTVIKQIQMDEEDAYERAYMMLNKWRQQMGAGANYDALAQALECKIVGRPDLSQEFCYAMD